MKKGLFSSVELSNVWLQNKETHHPLDIVADAIDGCALGRVAVAEAVAAHHKLIHGVVILFLDLWPGVKQIVSQRVQLSEVHPQVGDLELV